MSWLFAITFLGGMGAFYLLWLKEQPVPSAPLPSVEAPAAPAAKPEPAIRHPIQEAPASDKPLPPLSESDAPLQSALAEFFGRDALEKIFDLKDIVRRLVVTVDNLPRQKVPMRYRLFTPVDGKFLTAGKEENIFIAVENYQRYAPYVRLAEAVDIQKLVAAYVHFYPLFQQEYQNLGYPKGYFNDRLVEAIDNMLTTPDVKTRIKLVRPNVLYQFDDPTLEALTAGQKIILRMGPENAVRIKAKLRQIRQELTGQNFEQP
ncbi:MAG: DUF3014 domain-containing protein [Gammaproteobacteria bacterium]|nr:DUF3014 domain-containing protein [Gammaproteobacteria bacterium]